MTVSPAYTLRKREQPPNTWDILVDGEWKSSVYQTAVDGETFWRLYASPLRFDTRADAVKYWEIERSQP